MNKSLVSVIVPVYNVERYLRRCIRSLINQTYENTEIILIDDGSLDNSGILCDQLALEDQRIKVYHKVNGGLSDARNFGVAKSSGEYITFVDSDDYVSTEYVKCLIESIQVFDADIAAACYYRTEKNDFEEIENRELPGIQIMSGIEACYKLLDGGKYYRALVVACAKIIKSDIVKAYPFPNGRKHEDEATTAKYLFNARKVVFINQVLYAYYQNPDSITHTKGTKKNEDAIWAIHHRAAFFEEVGSKELAKRAYSFLFSYLSRDSVLNDGRCDDDIRVLLKGKKLTLRSTVFRIIYDISPDLYRRIRRF